LKKKQLSIRRATTLNEAGKVVDGNTKNRYSRRIIHLLPMMVDILEKQMAISEQLQSEYLFCSPEGCKVNRDNLRGRVWTPALTKAGVSSRQMRQTRHSFATTALSLGENPLWIAKVMGHSTTRMVIEVYAKYAENPNNFADGNKLNQVYQKNT
jgi:integrase